MFPQGVVDAHYVLSVNHTRSPSSPSPSSTTPGDVAGRACGRWSALYSSAHRFLLTMNFARDKSRLDCRPALCAEMSSSPGNNTKRNLRVVCWEEIDGLSHLTQRGVLCVKRVTAVGLKGEVCVITPSAASCLHAPLSSTLRILFFVFFLLPKSSTPRGVAPQRPLGYIVSRESRRLGRGKSFSHLLLH